MVRRILTSVLLSTLFVQLALADPVTYRQLRQDAAAAFTRIPQPAVVDNTPKKQPKGQTQSSGNTQEQGGRGQATANHPEFVRLPDGRIVKYGPGIICDESGAPRPRACFAQLVCAATVAGCWHSLRSALPWRSRCAGRSTADCVATESFANLATHADAAQRST
jgi:hypothetical protein